MSWCRTDCKYAEVTKGTCVLTITYNIPKHDPNQFSCKVRIQNSVLAFLEKSFLLSIARILSQRHEIDVSRNIALIKFSLVQDILSPNTIFRSLSEHLSLPANLQLQLRVKRKCKLTGAHFVTFTFQRVKRLTNVCQIS